MIKWHGHCRFAATLIDQQFDAWVMNVVPISGPNTLPAIFDRRLIEVAHDWSSPPALFLFLFFNFNCLQLLTILATNFHCQMDLRCLKLP